MEIEQLSKMTKRHNQFPVFRTSAVRFNTKNPISFVQDIHLHSYPSNTNQIPIRAVKEQQSTISNRCLTFKCEVS